MKCPKCETMILEASNNYHGADMVYGVFCFKCKAFVNLMKDGTIKVVLVGVEQR